MSDEEKITWWWKYGKVRDGLLHDLYCVWADAKLCKSESIFKRLYH
jgi:hypothetical protein